ncbi:transporter [Streptococcus pluranimalium]|uniref:transporter n=1 Tax=Streptococcus pluranimalium TaxID=82348 RepID=UPI0039FBB7AA
MTLIIKNNIFRILSLSRILSAIGSYLYNIVFIVYATSMSHSHIAVFIANIVTIIPTLFTFWIGVKADQTKNKHQLLIWTGFLQGMLFIIISIIISNKTFLVFSMVSLLNIVSDILSDYTNGLRMPIMQKNIDKEDFFEAYSFTQFLSYIATISGQTLGVWLLTTTNHNYSLIAILNALSFLLSSLLILKNTRLLTYERVTEIENDHSLVHQFKNMFKMMMKIFEDIDKDSSFIKILLSILLLNSLGGAINSIYHFYFLKHQMFNLNYGNSLVVIQAFTIFCAILGTLTPKDFFSKCSISELIVIQSISYALVGVFNILKLPILGIVTLGLAAYVMGKVSPKLDALLMEKLPSHLLAQSNNFLGLLFTLSLPLGVSLFSFLALYNIVICWIVFSFISLTSLVMAYSK